MPLTWSVALTLAALSGAAHSLTIGSRALMAAAPQTTPQAAIAKELEERDRIKTEVEKKMAEYLYSIIRTNAGSQQQQQQQQQRGMPAQVQMQSLDYPLFVDSSGETLLPSEAAARLLWKKSAGAGATGEGNKPIHFHPCYFNAVSCF